MLSFIVSKVSKLRRPRLTTLNYFPSHLDERTREYSGSSLYSEQWVLQLSHLPQADISIDETTNNGIKYSSLQGKRHKRNEHQFSGYTIDVLFNCFIVCPLTILFWSSTWLLIDLILIPDEPLVSACVSLLLGFSIQAAAFFVLPSGLIQWLHTPPVDVSRVESLFQYIHASGVILSWRGIWNVMALSIGAEVYIYAILLLLSVINAIVLKSCGNLISSPFSIELDSNNFQQTQLRFRTKLSQGHYYVLDATITLLIIQTITVIFWVSCWALTDIYIFFNQPVTSYLFCLLFGYMAALVLFSLQNKVQRVAVQLATSGESLEVFVEMIYKILAAGATVWVWRGLWGLNIDLLLTNHSLPISTALLLQLISYMAMLKLGVSRSLGWVNYDVDGEGRGCVWQISTFNQAIRHLASI